MLIKSRNVLRNDVYYLHAQSFYVYKNVLKTQFDMNIIITSPNERFNLRFL